MSGRGRRGKRSFPRFTDACHSSTDQADSRTADRGRPGLSGETLDFPLPIRVFTRLFRSDCDATMAPRAGCARVSAPATAAFGDLHRACPTKKRLVTLKSTDALLQASAVGASGGARGEGGGGGGGGRRYPRDPCSGAGPGGLGQNPSPARAAPRVALHPRCLLPA